jgi:hypothetical protein
MFMTVPFDQTVRCSLSLKEDLPLRRKPVAEHKLAGTADTSVPFFTNLSSLRSSVE